MDRYDCLRRRVPGERIELCSRQGHIKHRSHNQCGLRVEDIVKRHSTFLGEKWSKTSEQTTLSSLCLIVIIYKVYSQPHRAQSKCNQPTKLASVQLIYIRGDYFCCARGNLWRDKKGRRAIVARQVTTNLINTALIKLDVCVWAGCNRTI